MSLLNEVRCIADTSESSQDKSSKDVASSSERTKHVGVRHDSFFKALQFTADGTTIVTHNEDQTLRTFVLSPDLLEAEHQPHLLQAYATGSSPSNINSFAVHPTFNLQDTSSTLVLSSAVDLPIQLHNALDYSRPVASYPWIHLGNETYMTANSLTYANGGTHFVAGSRGCIALFDLHRPGELPVVTRKTASRRALYGEPSMHCSGLIMSLAISSDGLLAAGSSNRRVGIFSASGHGMCESSFSLSPANGEKDECPGTGVTSLTWSPCERYLLVAERQSDCVQVFDIRHTGMRVAWLSGRNALSTQRMGVEIVQTADGFEVWAGGRNGYARKWMNVGATQGKQLPDEELNVGHVAVGDVKWHPSGIIMATCTGERYGDPTLHESTESQTSLRIWTMT